MKNKLLAAVICPLVLALTSLPAKAQADEVPKVELGVQFTSLTKLNSNNGATEPGFGGRFTFNLNRRVALEAVGNFFPRKCRFCGGSLADNSGNITQALFGVRPGSASTSGACSGRPGPVSSVFRRATGNMLPPGMGYRFPFQRARRRVITFNSRPEWVGVFDTASGLAVSALFAVSLTRKTKRQPGAVGCRFGFRNGRTSGEPAGRCAGSVLGFWALLE